LILGVDSTDLPRPSRQFLICGQRRFPSPNGTAYAPPRTGAPLNKYQRTPVGNGKWLQSAAVGTMEAAERTRERLGIRGRGVVGYSQFVRPVRLSQRSG
jgi:hypothetical protein